MNVSSCYLRYVESYGFLNWEVHLLENADFCTQFCQLLKIFQTNEPNYQTYRYFLLNSFNCDFVFNNDSYFAWRIREQFDGDSWCSKKQFSKSIFLFMENMQFYHKTQRLLCRVKQIGKNERKLCQICSQKPQHFPLSALSHFQWEFFSISGMPDWEHHSSSYWKIGHKVTTNLTALQTSSQINQQFPHIVQLPQLFQTTFPKNLYLETDPVKAHKTTKYYWDSCQISSLQQLDYWFEKDRTQWITRSIICWQESQTTSPPCLLKILEIGWINGILKPGICAHCW